MIERFGLEGNSKGHLVQPPCSEKDIFHEIIFVRALSSLTLDISRDRISTTNLDKLFQCFSTLMLKNVFLKSSNYSLF